MQNDYLHTEILLEKPNDELALGEVRKGKIIFTPAINLYIVHLGYQLVRTSIGKHTRSEDYFQKKALIKNKRLLKGKTYPYEISITGISPSTYEGKNVSIQWEIGTDIKLSSNSYLKVRNDYLKRNNLSHFHSTNNLLVKKIPLLISEYNIPFTVENQTRILERSNFSSILFFFVAVFFTSFIYQKLPEDFSLLAFGGLVFLLFSFIIVPALLKNAVLKTLKLQAHILENNQFEVKLDLKKNWKRIRKVKADYQIIEEFYEEKRKDSNDPPVKYKTQIYQSSPIEKHKLPQNAVTILDFPEVSYDFIFDFPPSDIPASFSSNSLNFIWQIHVTVYFIFGLKSKFKQKIEVKRQLNNS